MRHKILAVILGSACVVLLAIIGVVSCTTTSSNPDDDLSATVVDLTSAVGIKPPPCGGIIPCPCSVANILPCKITDMSMPAPMPLDMSVLYSCCSIRSGKCSDCSSDAGATTCSACELVVSSRAMCAIECPPTGDLAVLTAPVVTDMRPACFGQTCSPSEPCCTANVKTLPVNTISGPTPICLTSGCGLYVNTSCAGGAGTSICTTTDGVNWSCRTCG